jgi:hypothetical protein
MDVEFDAPAVAGLFFLVDDSNHSRLLYTNETFDRAPEADLWPAWRHDADRRAEQNMTLIATIEENLVRKIALTRTDADACGATRQQLHDGSPSGRASRHQAALPLGGGGMKVGESATGSPDGCWRSGIDASLTASGSGSTCDKLRTAQSVPQGGSET